MKILSNFFYLLVLLGLAPYLTPCSLATNRTNKPLQGYLQKKGKLKLIKPPNIQAGNSKSGRPANTKTGNSYSVSQPYNPNNPPPIDNKIHPVSSNAR